ncbi:ribosomal protection-like ABC-F family protein [Paenibacillus sp. EKM211P]|uniref:ribosomal protection-like ABC-F family protein n=1 Tax=Paenibacillus sp. EKM211P TaxID=1683679 RepID=UPI0013E999EE|nr:ABC-F family ATP-binding cassette domain-containing protein [Paenibacillus sp. EKM211P]KAF6587110.1 ABC-F family ATP-binding cassette domain-containing protein [Paenibacillus sp. EKM211P]
MYIVNGQQLKKYHAANLILDGATFDIHKGEKVGLIGRNGSGKTTLLRLIARLSRPDEGQLVIAKDTKIGYLPQIPAEFESFTVYETLAYAYRELKDCRNQMTTLEREMSDPVVAANPELLEKLLQTYASLQERFERNGGYEMDASMDQIADGLGIPKAMYTRNFGSLSGGEKTKIALASQLIGRPDLLLLDEPTNHLDLKGLEWLEQFLQGYAGACVVISHDRYFLDRVAGKMIELEDGEAFTYYTNYSGYVKEKEERLLLQFEDYKEQQKRIKKMRETIRRLEEWGRNGDNEKFFKKAASIRKALERMELVKRPVLDPQGAEFHLKLEDRSGRRVLQFEDITKAYGERQILNGATGSLEFGEKVALLGDNGAGKTTLLKLLLGQESADTGTVQWGARVEYGYLAQQERERDSRATVLAYFKEEAGLEEGEARGQLAKYLFYGADVFKPVSMLSGGEWSRLRLALLVMKKPNLLVLDEPTNHLDIDSREALEEALDTYTGTVLAISHDRYFVNKLAGRVWELENGKLSFYLGGFDEYRAKKRELENARLQRGTDAGGRSASASRAASGGGSGSALATHAGAASNDAGMASRTGATTGADASRARSGSAGRLGAPDARGGAHGAKPSHSPAASSERLERAIAAKEAELAATDAELELLGTGSDTARMAELWDVREQLQAELDTLLGEWIELE